MLRWFRQSSRLIAALAVSLASVTLMGSADWWHANDSDGGLTLVFHSHDSHNRVFQDARTSLPSPEHCALCHWLRSFSGGLRAVAVRDLAADQSGAVCTARAHAPRDLDDTLRPARAPPA